MTEDGEDLRRRLYRQGADRTDIDAYLAVHEPKNEPEPEPSPGPAPIAGVAPARRVPRWLPAGGLLLLAVVVVAVLAVIRTPAAVGGGTLPTPLPTSTIDPTTSAAFVSRIGSGRDAGLAAWWDRTAPFVEEHGVGSGSVKLPPPAGSGRITVLLVVASDTRAGWSIDRLVIHDDRTIHLSALRGASGTVPAGVPAVGRLDYSSLTRPSRLLVDVPAGVRWGVAAVYTA